MVPVPYRVVADERRRPGDTWTLELEPAERRARSPPSARASSRCSTPSAPARCRSRSAAIGDAGGRSVHTVRAVGAATAAICARRSPGDAARRARPVRQQLAAGGGRGRRRGVVAGGIGLAPLRPALAHADREARRYGGSSLLYGGARARRAALPRRARALARGRASTCTSPWTARASDWGGRVGLVTTLIPTAGFEAPSTHWRCSAAPR